MYCILDVFFRTLEVWKSKFLRLPLLLMSAHILSPKKVFLVKQGISPLTNSGFPFFYCRAVWRPVEYHNQCKGVNPWKRVVLSYLVPVIVFSTIFNIPKFLEVEMTVRPDWELVKTLVYNATTNTTEEVNISAAKLPNFRRKCAFFSLRSIWEKLQHFAKSQEISFKRQDVTF